MKNIIINVSRETRMIYLDKSIIGVDGENLQGNLIFKFNDEFVNGIARLEYNINGKKNYQILTKEEESYIIPIKSVLTKEGQINMQLVITEEETGQGIPVFKSNTFFIRCNTSINAEIEQPEDYPSWIEIANQKLIEVEKAIDEVKQFEMEVGTLEEDVKQLEQDVDNLDIEINQLSNNMNIISGEVNTHTEEINNLENKYTTLNNELLEQEQSINHLNDIKADKSEIPDVGQFITKSVNDLVNYYKKTEIYTQSEVNQLIGTVKTVSMKIVPERPITGQTNIIYLIPSSKSTVENIYDEYIYVNDKWEIIGNTEIDLSNYYTKDEINTLLFDYITSNDLEEILDNYAKTSDVENIKGGQVIEIGSYQYSYEETILPAIPVEIAKIIYQNDKSGIPQTLHWTLYGTENNLKVVSSDYILGDYSIDVLVHNKFHCEYKWTSESTGNINPTIQEKIKIVDSLKENQKDSAPSVRAVKEEIKDIIGNASSTNDGLMSSDYYKLNTIRSIQLGNDEPITLNVYNYGTFIAFGTYNSNNFYWVFRKEPTNFVNISYSGTRPSNWVSTNEKITIPGMNNSRYFIIGDIRSIEN